MANTILIILLILAMIATVVALVRGIVAFLKTTEEDLNSQAEGPSASGIKQNKMMMNRIIFQGVAILIIAVLLLMSRG
jgi:uncharacterized membrane protein affecting hemolysin expression